MKHRIIILILLGCATMAQADSFTGDTWSVHFNLPDQNDSTTTDPGEWAIRDALLDRIDALQNGHKAALATYTFSANTTAGFIVNAISAALARGAGVSFVTDSGVNTSYLYDGTNSLDILAARPVNPLVLVQDDSVDYPVMHDKLGLFDYGGGNRQVFVASWNFTTAASSLQWNIALLAQNPALYSIYTNEMRELLAGRFHDHATKSHAHDGMTFRLDPSDAESWVRFGPYPESYGGNNAERDITNAIAQAQEQIVFALNMLTRPLISTQLIAAANRGVLIHGVIPEYERTNITIYADTAEQYSLMTNAANYTSTNRIHFLPAYETAAHTNLDDGSEQVLIHTKYMVIDPFGVNPMLIHGSANWTATALVYTNGNDENVMFIRNAKAARAFYAHFKRVTGAFLDQPDFWCEISSPQEVQLWTTDTNRFAVETTDSPALPWTSWKTNEGERIGGQVFTNSFPDGVRMFRAKRL